MDVQTIANAAGTTTRTIRDPYGAPIGWSGVWASGTGYMNKPATASTGLTTVGARTYDPVLGKFLSVDPVIDTNLRQQPHHLHGPHRAASGSGMGWGKAAQRSPPRSNKRHSHSRTLPSHCQNRGLNFKNLVAGMGTSRRADAKLHDAVTCSGSWYRSLRARLRER